MFTKIRYYFMFFISIFFIYVYILLRYYVSFVRQSKEDLKKERGEELSYPVLAFHGTEVKNISKICDTGFRVPGRLSF